MDDQFLTSFERLRNYRNAYPEILMQLEPEIQLAAKESEATKQEYHKVVMVKHGEHQYGCSIFHSSYESHCLIYLLIPRKNYFEAFGYDKERHQYLHYHDHFFQRYAQRMFLTHKSHFEIFKHYLEHNPLIVYSRYIKMVERMQYFHAVVRTGAVYGYLDQQYRIINFRTLISHFTLTGNKKKYSGPLRYKLEHAEEKKEVLMLEPPRATRKSMKGKNKKKKP